MAHTSSLSTITTNHYLFSPTAESFGVCAQISSGVVRSRGGCCRASRSVEDTGYHLGALAKLEVLVDPVDPVQFELRVERRQPILESLVNQPTRHSFKQGVCLYLGVPTLVLRGSKKPGTL